MFLVIAFTFVVNLYSIFAVDPVRKCFDGTRNQGISNSAPMTELWDVKSQDCLNYCISYSQDPCISVVYHKYHETCQLYSHRGSQGSARIVRARGHDYYKRVNFDGTCKSTSVTVVSSAQTVSHIPIPYTISQKPQPYYPEKDHPQVYPDYLIPVPDTVIPRSTTHATTTTDIPIKITGRGMIEGDCGIGVKIGYLVAIAQELVIPKDSPAQHMQILTNVDHSDCGQYCTSNTGPTVDDFACRAINYRPGTKTCELFEFRARPHGHGDLIHNDRVIYSEKFCLPFAVPVDCESEELFIVHQRQRIVDTEHYLQAFSGGAGGIADCVAKCVVHPICKAVSYNEKAGEWCTLHKVHLGTHPKAVVETQSGWALVENGCRLQSQEQTQAPLLWQQQQQQRQQQQQQQQQQQFSRSSQSMRRRPISGNYLAINQPKSLINWSSWSSCHFQVHGVQVRTRWCTDGICPDGKFQVSKC